MGEQWKDRAYAAEDINAELRKAKAELHAMWVREVEKNAMLYEALEQCRKELEEFKRLAHGKQEFPPTKGMEMADNALRAARGEK